MRQGSSRRRYARLTATVAVVALLFTGCGEFRGAYDLPLPGSPVKASEAYQITADFEDILNIVPRSPVMVDDVTVGEVTAVDRRGWTARVTMNIRDDIELPDNAHAHIRQVSLLGEKYIALEEPADPSARQLSDGDHIPLGGTGQNPEVEEVLAALSFLLSGGGVAQLGTITREANLVMSGREDRLRALLSSLDGVVGTLDDQREDIIAAMESMANLAATLNEEKEVIGEALDATGPAIAVLHAQHTELINLLDALDELGEVGARVINATKDDILAILEDLSPVLRKLREADDQLMEGLNLLVSFPFPDAARDIIQGDFADTIVKADIDFANLYATMGLPDLQLADLLDLLGGDLGLLDDGGLIGGLLGLLGTAHAPAPEGDLDGLLGATT